MCILYLYVVQISIPKIFAASNLKVTEILGMKPFRFSDGQNVHPCFKNRLRGLVTSSPLSPRILELVGSEIDCRWGIWWYRYSYKLCMNVVRLYCGKNLKSSPLFCTGKLPFTNPLHLPMIAVFSKGQIKNGRKGWCPCNSYQMFDSWCWNCCTHVDKVTSSTQDPSSNTAKVCDFLGKYIDGVV